MKRLVLLVLLSEILIASEVKDQKEAQKHKVSELWHQCTQTVRHLLNESPYGWDQCH